MALSTAFVASCRTPRSGDMKRIWPDEILRWVSPMFAVMEESDRPTKRGARERIAVQRTLHCLLAHNVTHSSGLKCVLITLAVGKGPSGTDQSRIGLILQIAKRILSSQVHGVCSNVVQRSWPSEIPDREAGDHSIVRCHNWKQGLGWGRCRAFVAISRARRSNQRDQPGVFTPVTKPTCSPPGIPLSYPTIPGRQLSGRKAVVAFRARNWLGKLCGGGVSGDGGARAGQGPQAWSASAAGSGIGDACAEWPV